MAVLRFKPYRLHTLRVEPGHNDGRGDWVPGGEEWVATGVRCDFVQETVTPTETAYDDGRSARHAYTLYLPKDAPPLPLGTMVRLVGDDGEARVEGRIRGVKRTQLETLATLWQA